MEWLKQRIRPNEPTLSARLQDVYSRLPTAAQEILGQRSKFARTITQTRNYTTHWSDEAKPEAVLGSDLVRPVYQLRLVTKLILLRELGLATDQVTRGLPEFRTLQIL